MEIGKIVLIVMDSVGIGELPDAVNYNDNGSDTLGNIIKHKKDLLIPNLVSMGIGNIDGTNIPYNTEKPIGAYGKAHEKSSGKDTTTGHWEIAGVVLDKPFPVYPHGFPEDIINSFKKAINTEVLFNKPASGTEVIERLGEDHMKTGFPIVYTSADSVFQIAAHESVIPVEKLYNICRIAREILSGEHAVGRVIARPFKGTPGNFIRTSNRKDFSLEPIRETMLDILVSNGFEVKGVGKINDIFAGRGITDSIPTHNNNEGIEATISFMEKKFRGLIFTNLVDFDMIYGHRNDIYGYAAALEEFDSHIPRLINSLRDNDILIITADHGCDPTTASTDHSREYIPILVYGKVIRSAVNLGIRESYADIGSTIIDLFGIDAKLFGNSFKNKILSE